MGNAKNYFPAVMKGTAAVSGGFTLAFCLIDSIHPQPWLFAAAITFGTICYHFSMRLLMGLVVPRLFAKADPAQKWFQPRAFEDKLHRFLRIRKWKKYVPTYAPDTFSMDLPPEQIARTMCISELVHSFIVLFSFLPLLLAIPFGEFPVFVITSFLAAGIDCLFILLQRYNRPRILRLLARKEARP